MKTFLYLGGPAINGATFRDGTQIMLHRGKHYELDETDPYIRTMLAKRDERGMAAPWLQEVEPDEVVTEEEIPTEEETESESKKKRRH